MKILNELFGQPNIMNDSGTDNKKSNNMITLYCLVSLIQLLLSTPADTLMNGCNVFMACSLSVTRVIINY